MQSLSCAHGGTLEVQQEDHTTASGCYNISEHHRELRYLVNTRTDLTFVVG
jgi:hypothetical protein